LHGSYPCEVALDKEIDFLLLRRMEKLAMKLRLDVANLPANMHDKFAGIILKGLPYEPIWYIADEAKFRGHKYYLVKSRCGDGKFGIVFTENGAKVGETAVELEKFFKRTYSNWRPLNWRPPSEAVAGDKMC
jgi:hypothetical protein